MTLSGAFGNVKIGWLKSAPQNVYAIKTMKKAEIMKSKHVDHIENEKNILEKLDHPFTVSAYPSLPVTSYSWTIMGSSRTAGSSTLRQSYFPVATCSPTTATRAVSTPSRRSKWPLTRAGRFYGAQIASVFEYLHARETVYRDLKPENIMIGNDGYLKLIDYGFAKVVKKRTYTICGTPEYIAPEILLNKGHGKPVDWWTFGVLIYEMHAGHAPFVDDDPMNIYKKIINTKPKYPDNFDKELKSLVKHLLRRELSKRYGNLVAGISDIKDHRFFKGLDYNALLNKKIDAPYVPTVGKVSKTETSFLAERKREAEEVSAATDPFIDW